MTLKRIFVCSRLRGKTKHEVNKHLQQARDFSKYIIQNNIGAPFTPHLLYTQYLDDTDAFERKMGIESGLAYLSVCDVICVLLDEDRVVSDGMKQEIQLAVDHGLSIRVFGIVNDSIKPLKSIPKNWTDRWLHIPFI